MKDHILYKDGDNNIPEQILDSNGQVVLAMCKNCDKAEIELDEPCLKRSKYHGCLRSKAPNGATHFSSEYKDCMGDWWFRLDDNREYPMLYVYCGSWHPTNYLSTEMKKVFWI